MREIFRNRYVLCKEIEPHTRTLFQHGARGRVARRLEIPRSLAIVVREPPNLYSTFSLLLVDGPLEGLDDKVLCSSNLGNQYALGRFCLGADYEPRPRRASLDRTFDRLLGDFYQKPFRSMPRAVKQKHKRMRYSLREVLLRTVRVRNRIDFYRHRRFISLSKRQYAAFLRGQNVRTELTKRKPPIVEDRVSIALSSADGDWSKPINRASYDNWSCVWES